MNDKAKPVHERLAAIFGSTTFKDLREGFGGYANITQPDLMAGLAVVRTRMLSKGGSSLGPEVLETFYAQTQVHRRTLVRAYLAHNTVRPAIEVPHRMGATLAAQALAGVVFHVEQIKEFAFVCNTREMTLRHLMGEASKWFADILAQATPAFAKAMADVILERVRERREGFLAANIRNELKRELAHAEKSS